MTNPMFWQNSTTVPLETDLLTVWRGKFPLRTRVGSLRSVAWVAKPTNYTITSNDNGLSFFNFGASAPATYTLPTGASGLRYGAAAFADGQQLTIVPQGGVIRFGNQSLSAIVATDSFSFVQLSSLTSTVWGVTAFSGNWNFIYGYQYATLLAAGVVAMAQGTPELILDPSGTIATATVVLPPTAVDGFVVRVSSSQEVTLIQINHPSTGDVNGDSFKLEANSGAAWKYVLSLDTWFRVAV